MKPIKRIISAPRLSQLILPLWKSISVFKRCSSHNYRAFLLFNDKDHQINERWFQSPLGKHLALWNTLAFTAESKQTSWLTFFWRAYCVSGVGQAAGRWWLTETSDRTWPHGAKHGSGRRDTGQVNAVWFGLSWRNNRGATAHSREA